MEDDVFFNAIFKSLILGFDVFLRTNKADFIGSDLFDVAVGKRELKLDVGLVILEVNNTAFGSAFGGDNNTRFRAD